MTLIFLATSDRIVFSLLLGEPRIPLLKCRTARQAIHVMMEFARVSEHQAKPFMRWGRENKTRYQNILARHQMRAGVGVFVDDFEH